MHEVVAYSTVAVTLGLVVARPRLGESFRVRPYHAAGVGVVALLLGGIVRPADIAGAAAALWQPFAAIASIMIMTEVAQRVGLLDAWAAHVERRARTTGQLFTLVFGLGVVTATALNNDAAILLLTPLVVKLVRRRLPERPELCVPFAFAVFLAAGVAPMPVSNPMNMVVAQFTGVGFNEYVARMLPIAAVSWCLAYAIFRLLVGRHLWGELPEAPQPPPMTGAQRAMMAILVAVLPCYSIAGYVGQPVWMVAAGGAAAALLLCARSGAGRPAEVACGGVSWSTLAFLLAVLILSLGLRNVGLVEHLAALYGGANTAVVGTTSALGSALLNNHPMSHLNMLALEQTPGAGVDHVLAALVGGDLGPRLLPMGSLAGLLWLEMLRRQGVQVRLGQFIAIGALVTVPTLAASLLLLA